MITKLIFFIEWRDWKVLATQQSWDKNFIWSRPSFIRQAHVSILQLIDKLKVVKMIFSFWEFQWVELRSFSESGKSQFLSMENFTADFPLFA